MKKLNFRTATEKDLDSIMKIEQTSFSSSVREKKETFLQRLRLFSSGFFIMEYENEVVGYLSSELWNLHESYSKENFALDHNTAAVHQPKGTELYISSMGIFPEMRGKGAGALLFQTFLQHVAKNLPNVKTIVLIVSEQWSNAKKIYQANGFQELFLFPDFFQEKEAGIVMRKNLI